MLLKNVEQIKNAGGILFAVDSKYDGGVDGIWNIYTKNGEVFEADMKEYDISFRSDPNKKTSIWNINRRQK
jgi:hypothetical protein